MDRKETKRLLREMLAAIKRIASNVLVVITTDSIQGYEDIMYKFDNRLEIDKTDNSIKVSASTAYRSKDFTLPLHALKVV